LTQKGFSAQQMAFLFLLSPKVFCGTRLAIREADAAGNQMRNESPNAESNGISFKQSTQ
jgi:hypothetical protein